MEFAKLYQELSNSTEMIRALLAGVTQEEAAVKPTPEAWSQLEVICHLHDEEREDEGVDRLAAEEEERGERDQCELKTPLPRTHEVTLASRLALASVRRRRLSLRAHGDLIRSRFLAKNCPFLDPIQVPPNQKLTHLRMVRVFHRHSDQT